MRTLRVILILIAPLSAIAAGIYEMTTGKQEPVLYLVLAVVPGALLAAYKELKDSGLLHPNRLSLEVCTNHTNVKRWWRKTGEAVQLVTGIVIPIRISNSDPDKTIDILDVSVKPNEPQVTFHLPEIREAKIGSERKWVYTIADGGWSELFNDGEQKVIEANKIKDYVIAVCEYETIRDKYEVSIKFRDNWRRKYSPEPVTINASDSSAKEFLTKTLRDEEDKNMRQAAVKMLAQNMGSEAIPVLVEALKNDRDSGVRYAVVVALGSIGGDNAVSALSIALRDQANSVAIKTAKLLGEKGNNETAINALISRIEDYALKIDPRFRHGEGKELAAEAAWSIGKIIDKNARKLGQKVILEAVWTLAKALDANHKEFGGALTIIGYNETARKVALSELAKFLDDKNLSQVATNGILYLSGKYPFTDFDNPDEAKKYALSVVEKEVKDRKYNQNN